LRQKVHGEMHALELAPGHRQVARRLGAAGQHHGVVRSDELCRIDIDADMRAVVEDHALGFHLCDAAVDVDLLHLEVGNAVAHQAAGLGPFLVDMHVVAGARELLRAGHSGRTRADNGDRLAGLLRWPLRLEPFRDGAVGDGAFDRFDGDRVLVDVERARRLAGRRTDATGHFREIVG
jgi:hypothetical protein